MSQLAIKSSLIFSRTLLYGFFLRRCWYWITCFHALAPPKNESCATGLPQSIFSYFHLSLPTHFPHRKRSRSRTTTVRIYAHIRVHMRKYVVPPFSKWPNGSVPYNDGGLQNRDFRRNNPRLILSTLNVTRRWGGGVCWALDKEYM